MACSQLDRQDNLLSECLDSLKSWMDLVNKHLQDVDKATAEENLNQIVESYCIADFESKKSLKAVDELTDHFSTVDNRADDVDEIYKQLHSNDTSTLDNPRQHVMWKNIFSGVSNNDVEEVPEAPASVLTDDQFEEMQDSIFCSNVFTPPIDPISKKIVQNPYKNRKCGHVYEHKFIVQYIKSMKNKAKCPYIGCRNLNFCLSDLKEDVDTKAKIAEYIEKSQQNAAADSEDDDD